MQLEDLVVLQLAELADVPVRRDHEMARRVRELVQQDGRTRAAMHDEPLLVVALDGRAEDAPGLVVR